MLSGPVVHTRVIFEDCYVAAKIRDIFEDCYVVAKIRDIFEDCYVAAKIRGIFSNAAILRTHLDPVTCFVFLPI